MELVILAAIFTAIAVLGLLGLGADSRDNENWNPGRARTPGAW